MLRRFCLFRKVQTREHHLPRLDFMGCGSKWSVSPRLRPGATLYASPIVELDAVVDGRDRDYSLECLERAQPEGQIGTVCEPYCLESPVLPG